jgi:hypothetical protein
MGESVVVFLGHPGDIKTGLDFAVTVKGEHDSFRWCALPARPGQISRQTQVFGDVESDDGGDHVGIGSCPNHFPGQISEPVRDPDEIERLLARPVRPLLEGQI